AKPVLRLAYAGAVLETGGGGHVAGPFAPRSAAYHAVAAGRRIPGAAIGRRPPVVVVPAIGHPLPDAAIGIVQAEGIGLEGADRGRPLRRPGLAAVAAVGGA